MCSGVKNKSPTGERPMYAGILYNKVRFQEYRPYSKIDNPRFSIENLEYQSRILDFWQYSKFFNRYSKIFKFWLIIQDFRLTFQDFWPKIQDFQLINLVYRWYSKIFGRYSKIRWSELVGQLFFNKGVNPWKWSKHQQSLCI